MENGDIPNGNIKASSVYSIYDPWKGRLNGESSWIAPQDGLFHWIQADVGYQTYVSGVVTQGWTGTPYWVTSMKVSTFAMSADEIEVFVTDEDGNEKVNCFLCLPVSFLFFAY